LSIRPERGAIRDRARLAGRRVSPVLTRAQERGSLPPGPGDPYTQTFLDAVYGARMAASNAGRKPNQLPPGRHGLSPTEVIESQRLRLLDGVMRATAGRGFSEVRVADILGHAGVSRKTFYENFDDKEECLLAAYDSEMGELLKVAAEAFGDPALTSWPVRARAGLIAFLKRLSENPEASRVCFIDVIGAGEKAIIKREATLRNFTYFIDAARGESDNEVPGRTAFALLGGLSEMISSELLHGNPEQLEELAPDLVYLMCLPFLGPAKARKERERTSAAVTAEVDGRSP
jgi:AcrR family transcriptional regulator